MPRAEAPRRGSFDSLSPDSIAAAVEGGIGQGSDGTISAYPSYVNRVYGLRLDDEREVIAKFYRPGRWSREGILDEHRFLRDCAEAELPVAVPLPLTGGETLGELVLEEEAGDGAFYFALFPKMGGRNFDAEADEDWLRLGSVLGRLHAVGGIRDAPERPRCDPESLTRPLLRGLLGEGHVHPESAAELEDLCERIIAHLVPRFASLSFRRIHGDCHRGNILDRLGGSREGSGLLVIDFDDMMTGPAVQDLWLLLPDHAAQCRRELGLLVEGYEAFLPFDRRELELVEGLRFMRMVYFLAWRSKQRDDLWFRESFPNWGDKAFWETELEDLRDQAELVLGRPTAGEAGEGGAAGDDEDAEGFASWEKEDMDR
jgi:Ser/Thr protein kinase RdoA (MazF antagonist)